MFIYSKHAAAASSRLRDKNNVRQVLIMAHKTFNRNWPSWVRRSELPEFVFTVSDWLNKYCYYKGQVLWPVSCHCWPLKALCCCYITITSCYSFTIVNIFPCPFLNYHPSAECTTENGMHCLTCYIYAFQFDTSDFSKRAQPYTLLSMDGWTNSQSRHWLMDSAPFRGPATTVLQLLAGKIKRYYETSRALHIDCLRGPYTIVTELHCYCLGLAINCKSTDTPPPTTYTHLSSLWHERWNIAVSEEHLSRLTSRWAANVSDSKVRPYVVGLSTHYHSSVGVATTRTCSLAATANKL